MDGFFLLDDPFTDMDTTRRAAAIQAIGTFAENHQVLFFTCHPEHARLSLSVSQRNAKRRSMNVDANEKRVYRKAAKAAKDRKAVTMEIQIIHRRKRRKRRS
jgi:hypothetical protein